MLGFHEMMKEPVSRMFSKKSKVRSFITEKGTELLTILLSIYIALAVDGWAEKRKEHSRLAQYYSNISKEIVKDTVSLSLARLDAQSHVDRVMKYADTLRNYKPGLQDTVTNFYLKMLSSRIFSSSNMVSYKSMVVSGEMKLIEDLQIRENLIALEDEYNAVKIWEDIYMDFFRNDIMKSFFSSFDIMEMRLLNKNYYSQPEFRNLIVEYNSFNINRVQAYDSALVHARNTYALISRVLNEDQ